jgi:hypothetical protein
LGCSSRQDPFHGDNCRRRTPAVLGSFADPISAARAYDAAARRKYGSDAFLNFANVDLGEHQVLRADDVCAHGHDLREHGVKRPGLSRPQCRLCRSAVELRYKARRRAAKAEMT